MTINDIKKMTDGELKEEIKVYDNLVHEVECFGVRDLFYLLRLEEEAEDRGIEIGHQVTFGDSRDALGDFRDGEINLMKRGE